MQLPKALQHFPTGALIVAADSIMAQCFLVGGDSLAELDGIAMLREKKQDAEGAFTSFDGSRVAGPASDIDDAPRLRAFAQKLEQHITALTRTHNLQTIHLVMPAEIEHLLSQELPNDVATKVGKRIHHDVMKEDPLTIVKRIVG